MEIDISKLDTRIYREGERCPLQYVECDECGEMFSLNLKERNLPAGGKYSKERYFVCPVCKHKYIVCRFDRNGVHESTRIALDKEGERTKG